MGPLKFIHLSHGWWALIHICFKQFGSVLIGKKRPSEFLRNLQKETRTVHWLSWQQTLRSLIKMIAIRVARKSLPTQLKWMLVSITQDGWKYLT